MKSITLLLGSFFMAVSAQAQPLFNKLICRSYDNYQQGGNRKVLEVTVAREIAGTYRLTLARTYEVLLAPQQYSETERTTEVDVDGLNCLQASPPDDPKVITCETGFAKNYVSLARVDQTVLLSSSSQTPGRLVKSATYEATLLVDTPRVYPHFFPEDCALN